MTLADTLERLRDAEDRVVHAETVRESIRIELVKHCAAARKDHGVSLRDMARRLGCSAAMLLDIERGRRWSDRIMQTYADITYVDVTPTARAGEEGR